MTTRQRLAWAPLLLSLSACRDQEARALQSREAEFRLKEACLASGTKFFHEFVEKTGAELTEVFYSPKRNSCICETRREPMARRLPGEYGMSLTYQLHDCLSVEQLGETRVSGTHADLAIRQRQKDALK